MTSLPRIAWFTAEPQENDFSYGAYVTNELLPYLTKHFAIDIYSNSFESAYENQFHYLCVAEKHKEQPYDFFFYNVEDKPYAQFIRVHVALIPGIVWFHHYVFTTFGPEPILNSPWKGVIEKFNGETAKWPLRGDEHPQEGPQGSREAAFAIEALFSNPASIYQHSQRSVSLSTEKGHYLPFPISKDTAQVLPLVNKKFTIAMHGTSRIEGRAHKVLEALSGFDVTLRWMLPAADVEHARGLQQEFSVSDIEYIQGTSLEDWKHVVRDADCALHLLYSAYNQPGPFLFQSLCFGKPCLVTSIGGSDLLSDSVVFKIEPGKSEAQEIKEVLQSLKQDRVACLQHDIQNQGEEIALVDIVSQELIDFLKARKNHFSEFLATWQKFQEEAKASLVTEVYNMYEGDTFNLERRIFDNSVAEFGW